MTAFSREMVSFLEVAREGSIRRAAKILNISPSSLSRQMTIFENSFGTKLLIRLSTGVSLTESGKKVYAQALVWSEDQKQLLHKFQYREEYSQRLIRLGVVACFTNHFITELHSRLAQNGINAALNITMGTTDELVDALVDGKLDVIVAFNVTTIESVRCYFEQDHQLGLVFSPKFDIGDAPIFGVEQCMAFPLCLPDSSLSYQARLISELNRQKIAPNIVLKTNSVAMIKDFVSNGKGVTFLTELDIQWEIDRGELVYVGINNKRLTEQLSVSTLKGKTLDARDQLFLDVLIQVLVRDFKPAEMKMVAPA